MEVWAWVPGIVGNGLDCSFSCSKEFLYADMLSRLLDEGWKGAVESESIGACCVKASPHYALLLLTR